MLLPGDWAPHFRVASNVNPQFNFDTVAGRYIVLSFFGNSRVPMARKMLDEIDRRAGNRFDVTNAVFFGVTTDPDDVSRLAGNSPGRIWFYDTDLAVSRKYGLAEEIVDDGIADAFEPSSVASPRRVRHTYAVKTFVLDQAMRIIAIINLTEDAAGHVDAIFGLLDSMPPLDTLQLKPPILIVPYVLEPELCKRLIDYYETKGGEDSGFMREVDGKTVGILDHSHKRRMDCEIVDQGLIATVQERIKRRVVPAIQQAYQFNVTRIERHIVACYDAAQGAHFKPHRDNTTLGTAHRRFAVTMNLNAEEYEGAELRFPEFGPRRYKGPTGSAMVFSCSLLHEVPPVTRGRRYAFLPFLYDDAAAAIRERNRKHLGDISGARGSSGGTDCNAAGSVPTAPVGAAQSGLVLDGTCGCGNPNGCSTCLNAATYNIGFRDA